MGRLLGRDVDRHCVAVLTASDISVGCVARARPPCGCACPCSACLTGRISDNGGTQRALSSRCVFMCFSTADGQERRPAKLQRGSRTSSQNWRTKARMRQSGPGPRWLRRRVVRFHRTPCPFFQARAPWHLAPCLCDSRCVSSLLALLRTCVCVVCVGCLFLSIHKKTRLPLAERGGRGAFQGAHASYIGILQC